jgi:hypothetical protein
VRDQIVRQAGKQLFEDLVSSDEQGMGMAPLRNAFARFGRIGEGIPLDDRHLGVSIRQDARGHQTGHAAADHHGMESGQVLLGH